MRSALFVPYRRTAHKMVCEGALPGKDGIGMVNYHILCRSLTYAQRSARALERAGVMAHVMRCPKGLSAEGCSHCVKIKNNALQRAMDILSHAGLTPKRVFGNDGSGEYEEVEAVDLF